MGRNARKSNAKFWAWPLVERCNCVLIVDFSDRKRGFIERLHTKIEDICIKTHGTPAKRAKNRFSKVLKMRWTFSSQIS